MCIGGGCVWVTGLSDYNKHQRKPRENPDVGLIREVSARPGIGPWMPAERLLGCTRRAWRQTAHRQIAWEGGCPPQVLKTWLEVDSGAQQWGRAGKQSSPGTKQVPVSAAQRRAGTGVGTSECVSDKQQRTWAVGAPGPDCAPGATVGKRHRQEGDHAQDTNVVFRGPHRLCVPAGDHGSRAVIPDGPIIVGWRHSEMKAEGLWACHPGRTAHHHSSVGSVDMSA